MSIDFNADEIFEMAIQIEKNGERFYRLAAEGTLDPAVRKMLVELAAKEDEHQRVFLSMKEDLSASDRQATTFDPQGEAAAYLRAMADGRVFDLRTDPAGFFRHHRTIEDILREAIGIEKDSIVFYLGMKEMVPDQLGKDKIDHIIREEMRHIATLSEELSDRRQVSTSQKP